MLGLNQPLILQHMTEGFMLHGLIDVLLMQ